MTDTTITEFSEYMFKNNIHNRKIQLNLEGIENNKDLFLFFIDLFCKGLVICFGENNSVDFDTLDLDKFSYIKTKMQNAGIHINLNIEQNPIHMMTSINSQEIDCEDPNKPVHEYIFKIYKGALTYNITFTLGRVL